MPFYHDAKDDDMNRTVDDYMNIAKERNNFRSDRQLALALGVTTTTTTGWRTKRQWPSDAQMPALARLAGVNPLVGIAERDIWRSSEPTRTLYEQIAQIVSRTAATALILLTFSIIAGSANASGTKVTLDGDHCILWKITS